MYNNYDYPEGVDNKQAPWNQEDLYEEKTVTVSISLSQEVTIKHYPDGNLEEEVRDQIFLPNDVLQYAPIDLPKWNEDEFVVVED